MKRQAYIPVLIVLLSASASAADKPPKPPKAAPPPAAKGKAGPAGGGASANHPPEPPIEKLANMPAAQREKFLSALPAERRAKVEAGIARWNNMTPAQKAVQEKFLALPKDQQARIRQLSQKIKTLPDDRKVAVRRELARLRNMPEDQRQKRLDSPAVKKEFSPEEQEILRESPNLLPQNYL